MPAALATLLHLMLGCSAAVGLAAVLWCRGLVPLIATTFGVALVLVLV
ncbi:hypothetical protein [Methylobacterium sp. CM6257]